jgi:hypothetical protein
VYQVLLLQQVPPAELFPWLLLVLQTCCYRGYATAEGTRPSAAQAPSYMLLLLLQVVLLLLLLLLSTSSQALGWVVDAASCVAVPGPAAVSVPAVAREVSCCC